MAAEEWYVSTDEERWNCTTTFASCASAVAGAEAELDLEPGQKYFVGRKAPVDTAARDWSDDIVEALGLHAFEQVGDDLSEGWPSPTKEQEAELTAEVQRVVDAWLDRNGLRPSFFRLVDVEEHRAPNPADHPAWWCPKCQVGVELGEEGWTGGLTPDRDSKAVHDCGTELGVR